MDRFYDRYLLTHGSCASTSPPFHSSCPVTRRMRHGGRPLRQRTPNLSEFPFVFHAVFPSVFWVAVPELGTFRGWCTAMSRTVLHTCLYLGCRLWAGVRNKTIRQKSPDNLSKLAPRPRPRAEARTRRKSRRTRNQWRRHAMFWYGKKLSVTVYP